MRQSTIITLAASAAFGIFSIILAKSWINGAIQDEYLRGSSLTSNAQKPAHANTAPVVIVNADVNFGDVLSTNLLEIVDYPIDAIPSGAYENLNDIFVDPSQATVVLRYMALNEPVLDYKISGPGGKGSMSVLISDGMRAVSLRVNEVAGVAGFIMPGDYVDVIFARDEKSRRNGNNLKSDLLLQNIKVLGIDQDFNNMSSIPVVVNAVTLEVANVDAQKLHLAQDTGKLSLTLRGVGDLEIETPKTIEQTSLINTVFEDTPLAKTRAKPALRTKPKPSNAANSNTANVTIIRGDTHDQVKVLKHKELTHEELKHEDVKLAGSTQ